MDFFLLPTSFAEIEQEISKLNVSKATGPFSIPIKILQLMKIVISKPLEIVFNNSFAMAYGCNSRQIKNSQSFPHLQK